MDISSLGSITDLSSLSASNSTDKTKTFKMLDGFEDSLLKKLNPEDDSSASFDSLLKSAMDMVNETNQYTNEAAEMELSYAMGLTNSTVDVQAAQMKANISLQYTVAVRNAVMDAYREIMQISF